MTANQFTTFWALPFFQLGFDEFGHSFFLDEGQVLYHAHVKMSAVPVIDLLQALAGKLRTFETEVHLALQQRGTSLFENGALLVTGTATGAVGHPQPLAFHIML
jgi:hypothetical protein